MEMGGLGGGGPRATVRGGRFFADFNIDGESDDEEEEKSLTKVKTRRRKNWLTRTVAKTVGMTKRRKKLLTRTVAKTVE